jgi:hypothetical protein
MHRGLRSSFRNSAWGHGGCIQGQAFKIKTARAIKVIKNRDTAQELCPNNIRNSRVRYRFQLGPLQTLSPQISRVGLAGNLAVGWL